MKNVTKPSISTLSLCISLLLLSGCGGNSQETTDNNKIILADGLTVLVCYNYRLSVSENLPEEWKKLLLKK